MSSLWELSTDTIVTAVIVVGISFLAIAWLFAGGRKSGKPKTNGSLEQRRLEGREAEVIAAQMAPPVVAPSPDPKPVEKAKGISASSPLEGASSHAMDNAPDNLRVPVTGAALPLQEIRPAPPAPTQQPPAIQSAEKTSAMSIAAALVRHDKREVAPVQRPAPAQDTPSAVTSTGGDNLTAIEGIDEEMAKELNDMGIRYFDQIVSWAPEHAAWITSRLSTPVSNTQRMAWSKQAKTLADQPVPANRNQAGQAG